MPEIAERLAANVVTSENLTDFMTERLDLAKPDPVVAPDSKAEEPAAVIEPPDEVPPQEGDTAEEHAEKVKNSYQKLREQRNTAREEAIALKAEKEAWARERDEMKARAPAQPDAPPEANPKPDPAKYTDQAKFDEDMLNWRVDERQRTRDAEAAQKRQADAKEATLRTWQSRVDAAKAADPAFEAKIKAADTPVHPLIEQAIYKSDVGPEILAYFADNKEVANSMMGMELSDMMEAYGDMQRALRTAKKAGGAPKVEAPKAPKVDPIEPIRGGTVNSDPIGSDGEFKGTAAEWAAGRLSGKIK